MTHDMDIDPDTARARLSGLHGRPGFMIRRLHQIAVALFNAQAGAFGLTTTQFGVLHVLKRCPRIDQVTLSGLMRLDRSTTGTVIETLEARDYVAREVGRPDRRRRVLALTPDGETVLERVQGLADATADMLLGPLDAAERFHFLSLLRRLIDHFEAGDASIDTRYPKTD